MILIKNIILKKNGYWIVINVQKNILMNINLFLKV